MYDLMAGKWKEWIHMARMGGLRISVCVHACVCVCMRTCVRACVCACVHVVRQVILHGHIYYHQCQKNRFDLRVHKRKMTMFSSPTHLCTISCVTKPSS